MSLFFILVLPMILIVVLGMTYGGMNVARVGIADQDGGPLARDLAIRRAGKRIARLRASGPPSWSTSPTRAALIPP